jgi:Kdo2-lipid IVA lauroyltransferase/acyltransferase
LMARRQIPLNAVVRPLRGSLNAKLMEERRQSGLQLIAAKGALAKSVAALRRGEVVAMLLDQVLPEKQGVFVPFFGRPACTSLALSMAALRTGAPVLVGASVREGASLRVLIEGPFPFAPSLDRKAAAVDHTARVTQALEGIIRKHPEQWLWLHRRWKVC